MSHVQRSDGSKVAILARYPPLLHAPLPASMLSLIYCYPIIPCTM
jgi:hypothetical protein